MPFLPHIPRKPTGRLVRPGQLITRPGDVAPYVPPVPEAPAIIGQPVIFGAAQVGERLVAQPASRTGYPTPTRTWKWKRSGVDIPGATGPEYDVVPPDLGDTLTATQIETNDQGVAEAESDPTAPVTPGDETPGVLSQLSAAPQDGPGGNIDVTYEIDRVWPVFWVWTTSATPPTPEQVQAGEDHLGNAAPDDGVNTFIPGDVTGQLVGLDDTLTGDHWLHCCPSGSDTVTSDGPVTISPPGVPAIIEETFDYPNNTVLRDTPDWAFWYGSGFIEVFDGYARGGTANTREGVKHATPVTPGDYAIEAAMQFTNLGTSERGIILSFEVDPADTNGFDLWAQGNSNLRLSQWGSDSAGELGFWPVAMQSNVEFIVRAEMRRSTASLKVFFDGQELGDIDLTGILKPKADQVAFAHNNLTDGSWIRLYDVTVTPL